MRIEYLKEFIVAAGCLNFTAAAKKLYLTQPKMSAHIAAMEKELGFPLFNRDGGISLTYEGKRFFEGASQIVDSYDRLVRECSSNRKDAPFKIALGEFSLFEMFPPTALDLYGRAVEALRERHPSLDVNTVPIDNNRRIADLLSEGAFDVSFCSLCLPNADGPVTDAGEGMAALPLVMDEMVAWIRSDHPLAVLDEIPVERLAPFPLLLSTCESMRTWVATRQAFMAAHGIEPTYHWRNASTPSAFVEPTRGDEVLLISREFSHSRRMQMHRDMTIRPLAGARSQSCFCLCFSADTKNEAVLELLKFMESNR